MSRNEAVDIPSEGPRAHATAEADAPRRISLHSPAANSLATALALSLSAGFLDAFTYIGHGHVFASAMTGNLVLLGVNAAALDARAFAYASPVLAYVTGVILAHVMMREGVSRALLGRSHVLTLVIEIAVLFCVALTPVALADSVLVSIITVSTSMQNTSFRNIGTRTYNSVIMTGNLQTFANLLAGGAWPFTLAKLAEARDLGSVIVSFATGAAIGAVATPRLGMHAVLLPAGLLLVGAVLLLLSNDSSS